MLALGVATIVWLPELPSRNLLLLLSLVSILLLYSGKMPLVLMALLGCGMLWGSWNAYNTQRPLQLLQQPHQVVLWGNIVSANLRDGQEDAKVVLRVTHVGGKKYYLPFDITLYWHNQQYPFCAGQRWQLGVRLRAVHARLNEGGFDSQRYAVSNGQVLQGVPYSYDVINPACGWRQHIIDRTLKMLPRGDSRTVIVALAFGERNLLSKTQRRLMQEHGVAHLLAISGLHIALAALFGWGAGRLVQSFLPVHYITPRIPLLLGIICGWGYVWLSGANPPALRAGVGCTFCGILGLCGYCMTVRQCFQWVVAAIVLYDPLTLLSQSFWLSVTAVGCLIFWHWLLPLPESIRRRSIFFPIRLLHLQVGIILLMQPLQIYLFHGISLTALLANLLIVPFVSFLLVPVILLGLLLSIHPVWVMADWLAKAMMGLLQQLPTLWLPTSNVYGELSILLVILLIVGLFFSWRELVGVGLVIAVYLHFSNTIEQGIWRLYMLDVGHGLAVVIERHGRALIYDTGGRWEDSDIASSEIIPWLRWKGLTPEGIIVSHMHADHSGGLRSLQNAYPALWVRSARRGDIPCIRGESWQWQGITFNALWPEKAVVFPENNDSCVLMVAQGKHRILLTGDLEQVAEGELVRRERSALRADILQVPHHGSNTSSSALFLRTVSPQVALSSSARYSPWRFPSVKVRDRYRRQSTSWHDTPHAGQINIVFYADHWQIAEQRTQLMPRWYHAWFGVGGENG